MADVADTIVIASTPGKRGPRGIKGAKGDKGDQGDPGSSGSGTIANTNDLLAGDGAGAAIASGVAAADVVDVVTNNTGTSSGTNTGDQTDVSGNAGTVTTNAETTGDVLMVANVTTLANVPKEATFEASPLAVPKNTGGWLEYEVTANDAYTGQTFQDIADLISGVLSAGARYEIEAKLMFSMSADSTGMKIAIHGEGSGSAATALVIVSATSNNQSNANTFVIPAVDSAGSSTILAATSVVGIVRVSGFVTTRSGGSPTISLQHLKVTSGTSTCLPGSKMRLRKCAH